MEYPTLFTAGTRWLAPPRVAEPEGVTVHEAGHQFWYGLVATNEFEHAWMDEGFNTFSTARTLEQFFKPDYLSQRYFGDFIPWTFEDFPLSRSTDRNRLAGYRMAAARDVQATPSWRYWPGTAGAITYNKTALWLQHARAPDRLGHAPADHVDLLRALRSSSIPGPRTSSPSPTR